MHAVPEHIRDGFTTRHYTIPRLPYLIYSVSQKISSPQKKLCSIFTRVKYIFVKFCQCVASYIYIYLPVLVDLS